MSSLDSIRDFRIDKLNKIKASGDLPYPIEVKRDISISEVLKFWPKYKGKKTNTSIVGRVKSLRGQGAIIFSDLDDGTAKIQALFKRDVLGDEEMKYFSDTSDIGDFVSVTGKFFLTKRGEKTIEVKKFSIISKSLRPLPDKWEGLKDPEEKMRKRYLDIIMDENIKDVFLKRVSIISSIKEFLTQDGYLEVETPMFHPLYGGASAMPFTTKYNALETEFFLRISPELYLKRLLVAGFPKVFELNRNFRNEGIDVTHSPEFTMLEFYSAYETAKDQRDFVERLLRSVVKKVFKKDTLEFKDQKINFKNKFAVTTYFDLFSTYADIKDVGDMNIEEISAKAREMSIPVERGDGIPKIMDNIYKKYCRPKLIQPTFIIDYPADMLPLAKRKSDNPELVDAFQLVIGGTEMVKAFSELNDPLDQRERFEAQEKNKKMGDGEAQRLDEDFLEAMEYGMPPAAGVGIGIDRLVMLLTNTHNIRDVILFPTLKPKN